MNILTPELALRANAESVNVSEIVSVLAWIHQETEHGVFRDVTDDDYVKDFHGAPEYRGGYIYRGWEVAQNDILPGADLLETRWSKSPTSQPTTSKETWDTAVEDAPIGAVLHMKGWFQDVTEEILTKVDINKWVRWSRLPVKG